MLVLPLTKVVANWHFWGSGDEDGVDSGIDGGRGIDRLCALSVSVMLAAKKKRGEGLQVQMCAGRAQRELWVL